MAKFFKSTWFKCVSVLLCLAVILGGLLAILNDVLYVSADERTARAIKKIYGYEVTEFDITLDVDVESRNEKPIEYEGFGKINKIYNIGDDILFQTTGEQGYKGGSVTLWIKVVDDNGSKIIDKIVLESYDKQTLMSKFDGSYYENFYQDVTTAYNDGKIFTNSGSGDFSSPMTGATYTAKAMTGAVNCVVKYFSEVRN